MNKDLRVMNTNKEDVSSAHEIPLCVKIGDQMNETLPEICHQIENLSQDAQDIPRSGATLY